MSESAAIPLERIQSHIIVLRGQRVLLDTDLAALFEVPTKRMNEQVKRNLAKFPEDFVFKVTREEAAGLIINRSQNATSSAKHRVSKALPYAFTEHGAIQAANILRSDVAVQMSVQVVRAFVGLRQLVVNHKAIAKKLSELDARIGEHDEQLRSNLPAFGEHPDGAPLPYAPGPHALRATISALPHFVAAIVEALHRLADPVPPQKRRRIGFGAA